MAKYIRFGVFLFLLALATGFLMMVAADPADHFSLVNTRLITESSGSRFITGEIQNNTADTYHHLQLKISLLKDDGVEVSSTTVETSNLGGGKIWQFGSPVHRNAVRFRFHDLRCAQAPESTDWEIKRAGFLDYEAPIE